MQELILELKKMVEAGTKKSELEESIGLPQNSLSAVLNGAKDMPASWIPKIQDFLAKPLIQPEEVGESQPNMTVNEKGELDLTPSEESQKRVREAMDKINKDFGKGSVMVLGEKPLEGISAIPTGSIGLNAALGIGGFPRGRIIEIYGPEASGKTTVALHVIAEAQKRGGVCAFIDVEHAFDETYARAIGVNVDQLHFSQPDYGEQALEEADRLICSGGFAVVIIDSVAALVPKGELEGEMGDTKMGLQARLMSQACRKLTASISKTNTVCIFINQLRSNIGNIYNPEVPAGGNALKFYSSVRLDVRRMAIIKDGEEAVGNRVKVKVVKNKVAPPFKNTEFDILYGKGINYYGEIVDAAVAKGIIQKSASWYSYKESKIGQGRDNATATLRDNPQMASEITKLIFQ
jgi:recombination protein RecA